MKCPLCGLELTRTEIGKKKSEQELHLTCLSDKHPPMDITFTGDNQWSSLWIKVVEELSQMRRIEPGKYPVILN